MSYKLRVDLKIISVDKLVKFLGQMDRYCYVVEGSLGDNPHVHCWFSTVLRPHKMRNDLRSLGLRGNSSYSLSKCDELYPIEYLAYMCKEGTVVWNNVDSKVREEAVAYDLQVKKSRSERLPVWKKIIQYCEEKQVDFGFGSSVARAVLQYHIDNQLLVRLSMCRVYIDTIMLYKGDDNVFNHYLTKLSLM